MRRQIAQRLGPIIVVAALGMAVYTVFFRVGGGGMGQAPERDSAAPASAASAELSDDGGSLRSTYRTINLVQKHYIDPTRIDPRAMLVAAMRAVQESVAEVIVRESGDELVVGLGAVERRFALGDVNTPWILLQRLREIFTFLRGGIPGQDVDFQKVEYSAINGMLERLDPHTSLLPPDVYRDMKDKTQGNFGGLGIVIAIRDGALTIISPIDETPAAIAGLKAGDQVVKIGDVSTVNLALNDAVNMMRGEPGTKVVITILRKGWAEPKAFELVRAIIEVKSVESKMLDGRVGYARIKDFQGNTAPDLALELEKLKKAGARALVLDLRNNPGGLLTAAIDVSDLFLKKGVIVTTAGQGPEERDTRRATDSGDEPSYPLVVLINSGSASASEIVAGALKNNGRALLVGQRTFGKGSVQVLYDYADGSALKLTTAQYLTPGDLSIQSVGVVPHVELLPMRADAEMLDLEVDRGYHESDLDRHFEGDSASSVRVGRSAASLSYLWTPPAKAKKAGGGDGAAPDAEGGEDDEAAAPAPADDGSADEPDYEALVARDIAAEMADKTGASPDVGAMAGFFERRAAKETARLVEALGALGVDWRVGGDTGPASILCAVKLLRGGPIRAGEEAELEVSVTNRGPSPVYRLLATTRSDLRAADDREIAFGRVAPSETVARKLRVKVPKDELSRVDDVLLALDDAAKNAFAPVAVRLSVDAKAKPRFGYAARMDDSKAGNGDGLLQKGERVAVVVALENVGAGEALDAYATLSSLSGNDVFLVKGREKLGALAPGADRQLSFEFEVKPTFKESRVRLELALMDADLRVYTAQNLEYAISPPGPGPVEGAGKGGAAQVAHAALKAPPALALEPVAEVVRTGTVRVAGRATDTDKVRDVYIFVGDDKVFFQANTDPNRRGELSFAADVALEPGINFIAIVAEESAELDAREVIAVRRDGADGMPFVGSRKPNGPPEKLGVMPTTP
jgi:carboxyl-terminal processing protease